MTSLNPEDIIKTTASGVSLGPSPEEIGAPYGRFTIDCIVAGTSVASTIGTISSHIAASSAHGVAGDIVGTTDAQTLTGKTLESTSNTITVDGVAIATAIERRYGMIYSNGLNATPTVLGSIGSFLPVAGTWTTGLLNGFSQPANGQLAASVTATYLVNYSAEYSTGTPGASYSFSIYVNNVPTAPLLNSAATTSFADGTGRGRVSGVGLVALSAGSYLTMFIASSSVSNPVVQRYTLVATKVN